MDCEIPYYYIDPREYLDPPPMPTEQTPWITRAFSTFRIRNDTRKPPSLSLTPDPPAKVWIPRLIIRTVYLCLQSFVVACYFAGHNAPGPDKCFRIWLTHLRGRASDKRLIFLQANDLRIPDVLHLSPRLPHRNPLTNFASFVFSRCCCCCCVVFCARLSRNCEVTGNTFASRSFSI